MSKFTHHLTRCWYPYCAVLYFILFQLLCSMLPLLMPWNMSQAMVVIFSSLFSNLLTMIVLVYAGYITLDQIRTSLTGKLLVAFMAFQLLASFGMNVIEEFCEIPDLLADVMTAVMSNPLGVLAVAIVGPIAEELTFRGGLMGGLMKNGYSAKVAIIVSALTFGIIHFNPVQVVFASAMGLLLGWAYWRTQSLMPCILMHIANNGFSVLMFYASENPEGRITDEIGVVPSLALMVVCLAAAYYLYKWLNKKLSK